MIEPEIGAVYRVGTYIGTLTNVIDHDGMQRGELVTVGLKEVPVDTPWPGEQPPLSHVVHWIDEHNRLRQRIARLVVRWFPLNDLEPVD